MKARSARRKVMLGARMRCGATWNAASILDVSGTGLGLAAPTPPPPGAYVELRRGAYLVVARVIWTNGERFGVRAQDRIMVDALIGAAAVRSGVQGFGGEAARLGSNRPQGAAERAAASRATARALQFGIVALFGAALAFAISDGVAQALAEPLERVSETLGQR